MVRSAKWWLPFRWRPAKNLRPHDAVGVIVPAVEQHAPETLGRLAESVATGTSALRDVPAASIIAPRSGRDDLRMLIENVDAALQQVAGIQVIVGCHFEQFDPWPADHEVVVGVEPMLRGWRI